MSCLAGHSCKTLWLDTLVITAATHLLCKHQYNCGDTDLSHRHLLCRHPYNCGDIDMSHRHLLCKRQNNCGDTDHSHRHLLCRHQYNCGDTDHSHRHLLCKHQYNCGDTDHSHRHLLCKHQYNCGATDHSHRHLLCKHQYNCGARTQLDTLSGPLQTRSPLWRALRRHRKRLRTVATENAKLGEHSLTLRPPSETGTLATHSGKTSVVPRSTQTLWCLSAWISCKNSQHFIRVFLGTLMTNADC